MLQNTHCKRNAVNHIFTTFSIFKNRHNMLDDFIRLPMLKNM